MCKCATKYCTNNAATGRTVCETCRCRAYRKRNVLQACYKALKDNAKRRHKHFDLTLEQFAQFARETNYIAGRGRSKTSYSIDRIDNNQGYTISNIRVLTNSDNSRKGNKILQYDWQSGFANVIDTTVTLNTYENIF